MFVKFELDWVSERPMMVTATNFCRGFPL